jgi:hypothetical protein
MRNAPLDVPRSKWTKTNAFCVRNIDRIWASWICCLPSTTTAFRRPRGLHEPRIIDHDIYFPIPTTFHPSWMITVVLQANIYVQVSTLPIATILYTFLVCCHVRGVLFRMAHARRRSPDLGQKSVVPKPSDGPRLTVRCMWSSLDTSLSIAPHVVQPP